MSGTMNYMNSVPKARVQNNVFDRSFNRATSMKMGHLVPVACMPVLPGEKLKVKTDYILRLMPLQAPIFGRVTITLDWWYSANRPVWDGFEEFICTPPEGVIPPAVPVFRDVIVPKSSLHNQLGLPIAPTEKPIDEITAFAHAHYQYICDTWYRDQNVSPTGYKFELEDGLNSINDFSAIRSRVWNDDMFTRSLPEAQKGAPVRIPLGAFSNLNVVFNPATPAVSLVRDSNGNIAPSVSPLQSDGSGILSAPGAGLNIDPNGTLLVDTSDLQAEAATIDELTMAISLQRFAQLDNVGGSRYKETIQAHYNEDIGDARINYPEFIGGITRTVQISEVLQTSETADSPQGNFTGHAISVAEGDVAEYHVKEWGYIICIASIRPDAYYGQGIPRHFSMKDRFDYGWPALAQLGEIAVANREIYYDREDGEENDLPFGYNPQYYWFKTTPNTVAGDMVDTLDYWGFFRLFDIRPNYNSAFMYVGENPRPFIVQDPGYDNFLIECGHMVKSLSHLPIFGTAAPLIG